MNLEPPSGLRDFRPEEKILRQKIFERIEKIFRRFGYDPIETPTIEYWEILKGKYGEEAENKLIWRFKLPYSDKEYALRYDQTVPLARFYSRFQFPLPFKRYVIDKS
ncbi:MAG: ATP phosphoribosyltransferase regulatory subunit, partial [Nanopusillaceae archaeon]